MKGFVYDAKAMERILGLPVASRGPAPQATDGEIVVFYGGWQLPELRTSAAGKKRMWPGQERVDRHGWKAKSGYYGLLLPVPGSNVKNPDKQVAHLAKLGKVWSLAPITVAATALLAHLSETGEDPLDGDFCRCAELLPNGRHAGLDVLGGRVGVYCWDVNAYDVLWLAGARLLKPAS